MPCRAANFRNSKKMFEEVIFLRFGIPRMVISDRGTHLTRTFTSTWQNMGFVIISLLHTTLRQVAKQKHQISKSRTFCRRLLMRWEQSGRTSYPMHCGLIERLTRHHLECPLSTCLRENLSFTGRVRIQSSLGNQEMKHGPRSSRNKKKDATLRA
jgi:hypothetical protein